MANHLKIVYGFCLLLIIVMEAPANPVQATTLEKRETASESMTNVINIMKSLDECKAFSKLKELSEALIELQENVDPNPAECGTYTNLTGEDRKVTYPRPSWGKCDSGLGPGWFRFEGAAGTRMPTSCPPTERCYTSQTGWLNGEHPTVADGKVTRKVCFHWASNCCMWSTNIQVRNCGSFYVYYFDGTPTCNLRYCSTD